MGCKAQADTPVSRKHTEDPSCTLYRAINGTPAKNLAKVIDMMGGIEKIIGPDDVVVIKPNVQWWNQGAPNLAALKGFVDLIMARPGGFHGEVVLAENCHRGQHHGRLWIPAGNLFFLETPILMELGTTMTCQQI